MRDVMGDGEFARRGDRREKSIEEGDRRLLLEELAREWEGVG